MNIYKVSLLALFLFISGIAHAQNLEVEDIKLATAVEKHEAIGIDTTFTADVGTIYCYTIIKDATDSTQINHAWYYDGEEKARIPLTIAPSSRWRTWSSKSILPTWTGDWRVEVEDSKGNVIAEQSFTIHN
ncbi:Protein of unknown function (DUF2914) [Fodinibius salinus]|uniref:DUF2914 domain-containing protein n=1 Tax=Fodinibius salinus TaxID=860790 RepID=A0A5D3YPS8_9BACT|nr:DUF2914 domain-containing protein [Fodinibius salinus]TYP95049.1 Protein of unknown function (DUF2914) [Fodinibius salinus]